MCDKNSEDFRPALAVFWTLAFILLFSGLGLTSLWGSEDRWAEISRNMILGGDWFHPAINGEIYFDKPLLSYWLIAIPGLILGAVDEFVVRLPSALAALAGLWGLYCLGSKLWNRKVAITACYITLTSLGVVFWARKGAADIANMSAIILAVAWYFHCRDKAGFFSYFLFFLICVLGAHTKGLPAIAVPVLVIAPDLLLRNNWKKHLKISFFAAGISCAAIYFIPFHLASILPLPEGLSYPGEQLSGLELVWRENVMRVFDPFDHKEPPYAYLIHLPRVLLPWTPIFVVAVVAFVLSYKKLGERNRWLLQAIVLIFLMFSASGSRRWYYILPIIPFCSLAMAEFIFSEHRENWKIWIFRLYKYAAITAAAILTLSIPAWLIVRAVLRRAPDAQSAWMHKLADFSAIDFGCGWIAALSACGAAALAPWIVYRYKPQYANFMIGQERRQWAPLLLSVWIMSLCFYCVIPPMLENFRTEKAFAYELAAYMRANNIKAADMAFFRKSSAKVTFYADIVAPVREIYEPGEVEKFLSAGGNPKFIICQIRYSEDMKNKLPGNVKPGEVLREFHFPWEKNKKTKKNDKLIVFEFTQQGN